MSCCYCCRKPRYKRLVDALFPEDPQDSTPVSSNMDKLLFFAKSSPDHLDKIGEYLAVRLRRSLHRERNGHVRVALKVTEKLLSECDARRLQLIADSYLDILHVMLESSNTDMQIMATNSFVEFAEREEGNTPYHRQYDFLIHRFASLSLTKDTQDRRRYHETRMAGLKGLRGVIKKIGRQDSLQINIWDLDHMNKIVPPFLFNIQDQKRAARNQPSVSVEIQPQSEGEDEQESLGDYSEGSLTLLITCAGLTHIDSVLKPILQHFDLNKLWLQDREFTAGIFVTVMETVQKQDRYKAIQALVDHLDAKVNDSWETKQGILDTLSRCVAVAADGSLGPSVLDIFRTLVRHLRISIENSSGESERVQDLSDSVKFQRSITKTVGEFAGVLPDYHKPDIMGLINSYVPVPGEAGVSGGVEEHPLAPEANSPVLSSTLVKCMRAVADTYHPAVLDTTFPDHLFTSLVQLFLIRDRTTQLDVTCLWHQLVDHHGNKKKIPLNTQWESLESTGLVLGEVSSRFVTKTIASLFSNLLELAKVLSVEPDNILAFYQLLFLLTLEFSHRGINYMVPFLHKLQDLAVREEAYSSHHKVALHATVAGVLYLVAKVSQNEILKAHIDEIITKRKETCPALLPDRLFVSTEESDGGRLGGVVSRDEEALQELSEDSSLLFALQDEGMLRQSPAPSGGSTAGPFHRESVPELSNHFSVSLDYGPDSPLQKDQISFNSLKEKVELVLTGEGGGFEAQGLPESDPSSPPVFESEGVAIPRQNPEVSFEEMVGKSSKGDDSAGLTVLADLLNTSSVPHSSPLSIPGTVQERSLVNPPQSAYDMELPTLH